MIDGVLNVYKEKGYTSHDVVAKLRGILHQKKIGHTGTLDPDAEGVLPVCLGKATRLCDMLTDKDKTYRTALLLGKETDTQDISGQILCEKKVEVTEEEVEKAVRAFVGTYGQIPPMYSALKVNGKRLYELARAGKVVEREARMVTIYEIEIESIDLPKVFMKVHCSKGTYIRTLCHDIGRKLGCGGCMECLLRTEAGRFSIEDSLTLAEIERLQEQGSLGEQVISIEEMFSQYPPAAVRPEADRLVHNGNPLKLKEVCLPSMLLPSTKFQAKSGETGQLSQASPQPNQQFRVYDSEGQFMGIYQWEQERARLKPQKMFLGG